MDMSGKRFTWAGVALILTIAAGSPAVADDVELLLSTPAASNAAKPNVLFIIDSSGSMMSVEVSQQPYDPNTPYSGPCQTDKYYWTTNSTLPECGEEADYMVQKTSFVCQQGLTQLGASGSYTDTMAQYRKTSGKWKWQTISSSKSTELVECASDSGVHGNGPSAASEPYARSGSNQSAYTSNPGLEVDWGGTPTHRIYTFYDGNYLNWYYNPPQTSMSRTDMVKAVTKNVLGSMKNVNVGFMRFHYHQGGPVIHAVKDLDTHRNEANAIVDSIPASGWTPLSETMYEAALYWRGMPGHYGETWSTDPEAMVTSSPMVYKQPAEYACAKNFVVLLTDGAPTQDRDAYDKVPLLPGFTSALGRSSCTGGDVNGACLDDVSEYLSKVDINASVPGDQTVTTYTIGFTVDLPILKSTAELSGGEYYLASDVASLTAALTDIVTDIFDRDISFTAPTVAVNAYNRTEHLNDLYVSVFRASDEVHWPGNLKKFKIADGEIRDANDNNAVNPETGFFADSAKNFWSELSGPDGSNVMIGGAANLLPAPAVRKLYTNKAQGRLNTPGNALSTANLSSFQPADFGLTGAAGEPTLGQLIDWARGADIKDQDNNPETTVRYSMGDALHAQPAAVVYGDSVGGKKVVLFSATNDGYLHALDAETGVEKWAFVPNELLPNLRELYFNENVDYKNYGIDGDIVPVVKDANQDGIIEPGTDFVYIVFGMRRGGDNYYMIDVSDPDDPILRWVRSFPQSGQSWSAPVAARVKVDSLKATGNDDAVLILGGGYDTSHDSPAHPQGPDLEGAGVFMLDLETGDMVWRAGSDMNADLELSQMTRSIPSRIRVIDMNGDGFADRMYAADLGGQIWRFDIFNGEIPNKLVAGGVIARFGAEGLSNPGPADTRRFYTTPDVAMFTDARLDRRFLAINIGSGYRAHPLDKSAADRFYSLRDPDVFSALTQSEYDTYQIVGENDLIEVSGQFDTIIPGDRRGWRFTLPPEQKILSAARTFNDAVYFVSFEPSASSDDPCQAGLSLNRLYRVNVVNGDPVLEHDSELVVDQSNADQARVTRLEQGGIAPQPAFLFPAPWDPENCDDDDECAPTPIACVGVECFDPNFANHPVRTLWTQDGIE